MPNDTEIADTFLRSDSWIQVRECEGFKRKHVMKDAIRDFLRETYAWLQQPDESVELERYVGRLGYLIRSRWGVKAARTTKKRRALRRRRRLRKAESVHKRYLAAKIAAAERKYIEASPLLFKEGLPIEKKPPRKVA